MYTYKVVIHPNNKQRTKILNTMNKCIECQNIVFDILSSYVQRKEKIPSCSDIRKLFTNIKKEKDIETINKRIGLTKKEQREKHLDVLFYGIKRLSRDGTTTDYKKYEPSTCNKVYNGIDYLNMRSLTMGPWYLFRRNFLITNNLFFVKNIRFEDALVIINGLEGN